MKNLKLLRLLSGKSQQEIAEVLQTSRATYSNYERCAREPSVDNIIKLAEYFGVTTDFLLGHTVTQQMRDNDIEQKIIAEEKDTVRFLDENKLSFNGTIYDLPEEQIAFLRNAVKVAVLLAQKEVEQTKKQEGQE